MAGKKVAIDLGTSNTIIALQNKDIILSEPTVVSISLVDKKILAVGQGAKDMLGKVPGNIVAKRPLRQGVIASYKLTEALLSTMLTKVLGKTRFFKPEVMVSVPAGITSVEERAVIEAVTQAGAGKVYLIPEPLAAAIGAKLPISSSSGNMIVNIGGGTTEIAVISMNGIVTFKSKRVAGDTLNDAIISYIKKRYSVNIGEQMAEKIKIEIGSAILLDEPLEMEVRGTDVNRGLPTTLAINSNDIVEAMKPVLSEIVLAIKSVLERTPPELASDIIDRGMALTGGNSLLRNIDELFTKTTGVPAYLVEEPQLAVVYGISESLEHLEVIKRSLKGS